MKYKLLTILLIASTLMSCTKELKELNRNPNVVYDIKPGILFAGAQFITSKTPWISATLTAGALNHQLASLETYWAGDKYLDSDNGGLFSHSYGGDIKNLVNLLEIMKSNADYVNHIAMTRIWKVLAFQRVTDWFGDVPYSEAARGFYDGIIKPKYDPQELIYKDMLKELDEAAASFDPAKPNFGVQDMAFGGDITKWKKFAYSLMLRLALRIADKDEATAKTYIAKAITGGVMTGNSDNVIIKHSLNPDGRNDFLAELGLETTTRNRGCIAAFFVNWLNAANDPRLPLLFNKPTGSATFFGLPNGYDITTIGSLSLPNQNNRYTLLKANLLANEASPNILMSSAEVKFMLAEVAKRNLGTAPNAKTSYDEGVKAAMQMYTVFNSSLVVSDAEVATYLAANPYDDSRALEMINYQYWAATFLNFHEGYANIRRSDFPKFPDNVHASKLTAKLPTRHRYPVDEGNLNSDNVKAAIARIPGGADVITAKVWWDVN